MRKQVDIDFAPGKEPNEIKIFVKFNRLSCASLVAAAFVGLFTGYLELAFDHRGKLLKSDT